MVFKCQEDSFLKEWNTNVLSCEKTQFTDKSSGKAIKLDGYNVILTDTILFPEGGGQPCDYGFINEYPVKNVTRKGAIAVHFIVASEPLTIGEQVELKIDWERRHDHMQQHSGQHLISALFETEFNYNTKSWWLGTESSYVELDTKDVTENQLKVIEDKSNELIAAATKVSVQVCDKNDPALDSDVLRATRGLPDDHEGAIRIITIHGVDSNMCCGTHVTNLSQLQIIKLLNVEKAKGKLLLHFLVGNRVNKKLSICYNREQQLNLLLNGGPDTHVDLIKKLQIKSKSIQRCFVKLIKESAVNEANKLKSIQPVPKFYIVNRSDGIEPDYINTFLREVNIDDVFLFVTISDDTGKGQFTVRSSNTNDAQHLGPLLSATLDGKGNGKNNLYQAKFNNAKKLNECEQQIINYFNEK